MFYNDLDEKKKQNLDEFKSRIFNVHKPNFSSNDKDKLNDEIEYFMNFVDSKALNLNFQDVDKYNKQNIQILNTE